MTTENGQSAEDAEDIRDAEAALAQGGRTIPLEEAKKLLENGAVAQPLPECVVKPGESVAVEGTFASPEETEAAKRETEDERLEDLADDGFEATLTLTKGSNVVTGKVDVKTGDGVRELMLQLADAIDSGHNIDLGHPSNSCSKCGKRAWQVQDGEPCTPKAA